MNTFDILTPKIKKNDSGSDSGTDRVLITINATPGSNPLAGTYDLYPAAHQLFLAIQKGQNIDVVVNVLDYKIMNPLVVVYGFSNDDEDVGFAVSFSLLFNGVPFIFWMDNGKYEAKYLGAN